MILGAGVSALFSVGVVVAARSRWDLTTPAALVGLLFAASYAYGIARTVPWKWLVTLAIASASLVVALNPADLVASLAGHSWIGVLWLTFVLYGAMLLLSGGISFWLYLRHTQAPSQAGQ